MEKEGRRTHGMSLTKIYRTWASMKTRCNNNKDKRYNRYGGRGVQVCESWNKFENFFKDMGDAPKNMSLDRIDNNGSYCKENCKWSTLTEQNNNKRNNRILTFNGESLTMSQWARKIGIRPYVIRDRLKRGWSVEKALTVPFRSKLI